MNLLALLESMNGSTVRKHKRASNICVVPGCGELRHKLKSKTEPRCKKHYDEQQREYHRRQKERRKAKNETQSRSGN